jgi:hypothetical protein
MNISVDEPKLDQIRYRLRGIKNGLGQAVAGAENDTAAKIKLKISRDIRDKILIKKQDIDPFISIARANPSDRDPHASVTLAKSKRLPLKYFGARQTGGGVSYRVASGSGRDFIPHAFGVQIAKLGNQVVERTGKFHIAETGRYQGKHREIVSDKKRGPSPWGVFVLAGLMTETVANARKIMDEQLERRVKFLILKHTGAI